MGIFSPILDLLFPPRCVFCHGFLKIKRGAEPVCAACRGDLPYTRRGGEKRGDFFSVCVAPLYYEGDVRESLHRYKFHGTPGYAGVYGALVADCIRERLRGRYDLISWVPLSRARLKERGYDQSKLLAEAAAAALGETAAVVVVKTLEKTKNAAKQSTVGSAEKRRANIAGAYRVPNPALVAGRRVLLIDDIVTTGATLSECARTLRAAGAGEIVCAALARTRDDG